MTKKLIPVAIIVAGTLIAGAVVYVNYSKCQGETDQVFLSAQQAADKMLTFVNEAILSGQATASLTEVLEENGLYKVKFNVEDEEVEWRITKDGKIILPQAVDLESFQQSVKEEAESGVEGGFSVSDDELCLEDGKPIIYFFGSQSCPHCNWEHPIVEEVAKEFEGYIFFHNNMDSEADGEIFQKYSSGGIPTLVLGCKYYRVGSGEGSGEEQEKEDLITLICQLTNNQPQEVCQK